MSDSTTKLPYTREERTLIAELLVVDEPLERGSNLYKRWGAMMDRHRSVASSCWHAAQMLLETEQSFTPACMTCDLWNSYCPTHNVINREGVKVGPCGRCCWPDQCIVACEKPPVKAPPQDDRCAKCGLHKHHTTHTGGIHSGWPPQPDPHTFQAKDRGTPYTECVECHGGINEAQVVPFCVDCYNKQEPVQTPTWEERERFRKAVRHAWEMRADPNYSREAVVEDCEEAFFDSTVGDAFGGD